MIALLLITQKPCAKPFELIRKPISVVKINTNDLPKVLDFFLIYTDI